VLISIWFDSASEGNLRSRVVYEVLVHDGMPDARRPERGTAGD
jgi:hypothetical protein